MKNRIAQLGKAEFPIPKFNIRYVRGTRKVHLWFKLHCALLRINILKDMICPKSFGGSFLYRNSVKSLTPQPGRRKNKLRLISTGLANFSASPISNKEHVRSIKSKEKSQIIVLYKHGFTTDQYS
jgi:hypothetical protein